MVHSVLHGGVAVHGQSQQIPEQQTKALNLSAYAELLRSDVRAQKVAILTEVMGFTEAEDKAFWPIYREFDLEMSKLGDERIGMIEEYARNYAKMTDALATTLGARAIDLEARRRASRRSLRARQGAHRHGAAVSAGRAQLAIIDLQISSALPIVK
jgi:hypothetical protein